MRSSTLRRHAALLVIVLLTSATADAQSDFIRSDCDGNNLINIVDAAFVLDFLFQGGAVPDCFQACDSNDDGVIDIVDSIFALNHQLQGGPPPPPPFPDCGAPTTPLGCAFYVCSPPPPPLPNPDFVLSATDADGVVGGFADVSVLLDCAQPVEAWTFGVCQSNTLVEPVGISLGADGEVVNNGGPPDFLAAQIIPGEGWTAGVLVSIITSAALPAGVDRELHVATYSVLDNGVTTLTFCGALGTPSVPVVLVVPNGGELPDTEDGTIFAGTPPLPDGYLRGDCDGDNSFNGLVDMLFLLAFQFQGGATPPCLEAADVDGDGVINGLVDGLYGLAHQFGGGPAPSAPYPVCDLDPTPGTGLGCVTPTC